MPLSIKNFAFWIWLTFMFLLIVYLFINYHTPKGIWVGLQPTFLSQVSNCIEVDEKVQDIEGIKLWIIRLKNRIPIKNEMYDETIKNLKKWEMVTDIDKSNVEAAILRNESFRTVEIDFLEKSIKFNNEIIKKFIILDGINYCFIKNKIKWRMSVYRKSFTYFARDLILNENEIYWNRQFLIKFGKTIF